MENEKKELIKEMISKGITLADFTDYVIETNGIIGVGLFSLADAMKNYIEDKVRG